MSDYDHNDELDDFIDKLAEVKDLRYRLENAQDFFAEIYYLLQSDKPLDLGLLQWRLSEAASYLNIDEKQFGNLTIERKIA